ncbi:hypothetical protein I6H88_11245 [Elizabethkingia bruuniana]|uniref:Phosphoenolpyruvate carboxykinase n=2 Tax=Elizabethkingia TaxID=308865 RepID=A0A7T7UVN1_9FLAO|nr:hypothetical protein [Elizabethkingia bruuniana]KGO10449.1 hypothetical protein KS04_09075 [Elizabethkingia miricola]AQX83637.1 hypothetical protein AYC65_00755 [Elizabethkingia bruuniana]KUY22248.1 hypothetical protein ATB97_13440 [Elizabethkingia bruuniana]OPB62459.1 hypothetical protein BAY12_11180 [Elizabethkingia bruuniana]QDZ63595.1 hypothetical protein EVD20_14760 [Elizabethkingia bruuniana]
MQNDKMKFHNDLKSVYFQIADHIMELILPMQIQINRCLPSFIDFITERPSGTVKIKVKLELNSLQESIGETKLLSDVSIVWGDRFRFEESSENYITSVQSEEKSREWKMFSTKDFSQSTIYVLEEELYTTSILSWLLMVAFGQAMLKYNTVLFHASVIEKDGSGYAFLGKSGTGKSTHSRLWLKYISDTKLLNDDNPAVRIMEDERIVIYGTPWSGKTPCYRNVGVLLEGLVRLRQAPENQWKKVSGKEALLSVLPSCTAIRWNRNLFDQMLNSLEKIITNVNVGQLSCLPDQNAAYLCSQELIKNNKL